MGDKDSKLIFEAYKNINEQVYENEDFFNPETYDPARTIGWNALQILDPTGVLSYPEVVTTAYKFTQDPSWTGALLILLALFQATPNLGIGAGPGGAIAWGAAKKSLKGLATEAATNPKVLTEAANIALKYLTKHQDTFIAAIDKIDILSKSIKDELKYIITVGKVDNVQHLDNVIKAMEKVSPETLRQKIQKGISAKKYTIDGVKYATKAVRDVPSIVNAGSEASKRNKLQDFKNGLNDIMRGK